MRTALCLLVLLASASALPPAIQLKRALDSQNVIYTDNAKGGEVENRNNVIEIFLLGLVEELRNTMVHGSDNMRVLDPLKEEHIDLDLTSLLADLIDIPIKGNLSLSNFSLNNLSTFVVDELSFNMLTQVMDIDGYIPVLEILADNYDLNVDAGELTVFGNGRASIRIINGRVKGSARATVNIIGGIGLNVQNVDLQLRVEGFESNLENLLGNGPESDFANSVLANLVPTLVDQYQTQISEFLNELVMTVIDELL